MLGLRLGLSTLASAGLGNAVAVGALSCGWSAACGTCLVALVGCVGPAQGPNGVACRA